MVAEVIHPTIVRPQHRQILHPLYNPLTNSYRIWHSHGACTGKKHRFDWRIAYICRRPSHYHRSARSSKFRNHLFHPARDQHGSECHRRKLLNECAQRVLFPAGDLELRSARGGCIAHQPLWIRHRHARGVRELAFTCRPATR